MLARTAFFDIQDADGLHMWAQCDEWRTETGESRRVDYQRLDSWSACRAFWEDHQVQPRYVGIDIGHRFREVLSYCARWKCYGYRGDETLVFPHYVTVKKNEPKKRVWRNWSEVKIQDSNSGKPVDAIRGRIRPSDALTLDWSNTYFYPILYSLKNGDGRYYGIARDMPKDYLKQINSMIPGYEDGKLVWTNNGPNHAWDTSCGSLVIAMRAGWFRVDGDEKPSKEPEIPKPQPYEADPEDPRLNPDSPEFDPWAIRKKEITTRL